MPKRVLVIVAHADDMEFMAGGTIAKMAGLGYEIREVIATNNERGTLDPDWSPRFTADPRLSYRSRRNTPPKYENASSCASRNAC